MRSTEPSARDLIEFVVSYRAQIGCRLFACCRESRPAGLFDQPIFDSVMRQFRIVPQLHFL